MIVTVATNPQRDRIINFTFNFSFVKLFPHSEVEFCVFSHNEINIKKMKKIVMLFIVFVLGLNMSYAQPGGRRNQGVCEMW